MARRAYRAGRELAAAVVDGVAAPAGLLLLPLTAVCLLLSPVGVGVPATVRVIGVTRSLAQWHRRRAGSLLGRPVDSPYAPGPPGFRSLLRETATWRDLGWLALNGPLGLGVAAISVGLGLAGLQCLFAPAIQPLLPPGVVFDPLLLDVTDQPRAWLMVLASPVVLLAAATVPGLLNRLRARVAAALLAPTAATALRDRVGRLAASRADAVDSSASELRRIERDLHDGAQARLVSLSMNLGIAEDVLDADPALARKMILDARENAGVVLGEIRDLVRGIHPPVLADRGLPGAVQALALASPVPVDLDLRLAGPAARAHRVGRVFRDRRGAGERHPAQRRRPHLDHARPRRRPRGGDRGRQRPRGRGPRRRHRAAGHPAAAGRLRRQPDHQQPGPRADRPVRGDSMRVVIAEDQTLLRDGLTHMLTLYKFEVVAAVEDGEQLLEALRRHRPDVAVVDIRLPPSFTDEGLRAAIAARREIPGLPILILSQYVERLYARELLSDRAGAVGYLLKDRVGDVRQFVETLRRVAEGQTVMDPQIIAELVNGGGRLAALTPRERTVLAFMAEGRSNGAIAALMHVSDRAVSKHINSIFAKLDLPLSGDDHRRVLAVLAYLDR